MRNVHRVSLVALLLGLVLVPAGCSKEQPWVLPETEVYFTVILTLPEADALRVPGGVHRVDHVGFMSGGVYVVRSLSPEEAYEAYDCACPHHLDDYRSTYVKDGAGEAVCPKCKRSYNLYNLGMTSSGNERLQNYRTHWSQDVLTVQSAPGR